MSRSFKYEDIYADLFDDVIIRQPCVFKLLPTGIYNKYSFRGVRDKSGFVYFFSEIYLRDMKDNTIFSVSRCEVCKKESCCVFALFPENGYTNIEQLADGYPTRTVQATSFLDTLGSAEEFIKQPGWTKKTLINYKENK